MITLVADGRWAGSELVCGQWWWRWIFLPFNCLIFELIRTSWENPLRKSMAAAQLVVDMRWGYNQSGIIMFVLTCCFMIITMIPFIGVWMVTFWWQYISSSSSWCYGNSLQMCITFWYISDCNTSKHHQLIWIYMFNYLCISFSIRDNATIVKIRRSSVPLPECL